MLVDTHRLREHLKDPEWVVFDCRHDLMNHRRGLELYETGHIPGAFFAPVETVLSGEKTGTNGRHPLPDARAFAQFLAEHGVNAASQIVAYDDVGGQYAARFWWMARWIGLSKAAVLDGGFPKWQADGSPITRELPAPRRGNVVAQPNATMVATVDEVSAGVTTRQLHLLDARAPERFRGETEPIDRVAGHIPTARNRFFKLNLRSDLTMRPAGELKPEFEGALGGAAPASVVHQCGSGVTACVNLLAMEHAGLRGSRLYVGSWSEWIADSARPVSRGEA